jgi:hypothetical protein
MSLLRAGAEIPAKEARGMYLEYVRGDYIVPYGMDSNRNVFLELTADKVDDEN